MVQNTWVRRGSRNLKDDSLSYAARVRRAMKTGASSLGHMAVRELARRVGYSYEHVRKAYNGETHYISPKFNKRLCKALGLDETDMWQLVQAEKMTARFGGDQTPIPKRRLDEIWKQLSARDHRILEDIALVLLEHRSR